MIIVVCRQAMESASVKDKVMAAFDEALSEKFSTHTKTFPENLLG